MLHVPRDREVFMRMVAICLALVAVQAEKGLAQLVQARDWDNPSGGAYGVAGNWVQGNVPNSSNESANFRLDATYTVSIDADYAVASLHAGPVGRPTLDVAFQHTYAAGQLTVDPRSEGDVALTLNGDVDVTGVTRVGGSLSVGRAELALRDAVLTSAGAELGVNAAARSLVTLDEFSSWVVDGPLVVGDAGDAELILDAGPTSICVPIGCVLWASTVSSNSAVVGRAESSDATATVRGKWTTGDLIVGDAGEGHIRLMPTRVGSLDRSGELFSSSASLGAQPGGAGWVELANGDNNGDLGGEWRLTGDLNLGGTSTMAGGEGLLTIGKYNTVLVGGDLRMWPGAELELFQPIALAVTGVATLDGELEYTPFFANPQAGEEFRVLTAEGGVSGQFSSLTLPALGAELSWVVDYKPTSVWLRVIAAPTLDADFDSNGVVNAADLARWRAGFGTGTTRAQGNADGDADVDGADFLAWQRQLGSRLVAVSNSAAVPEPATLSLLMLATTVLVLRRRSVAEEVPTTH